MFENLDDAIIISKPMFAACEVKMKQIILFTRKLQISICFSAASWKVLWEFLTEAKFMIFVVEQRLLL